MTVTVPLPQGGYPVHIQPGALRQTGALLAPLGIDRWARCWTACGARDFPASC